MRISDLFDAGRLATPNCRGALMRRRCAHGPLGRADELHRSGASVWGFIHNSRIDRRQISLTQSIGGDTKTFCPIEHLGLPNQRGVVGHYRPMAYSSLALEKLKSYLATVGVPKTVVAVYYVEIVVVVQRFEIFDKRKRSLDDIQTICRVPNPPNYQPSQGR